MIGETPHGSNGKPRESNASPKLFERRQLVWESDLDHREKLMVFAIDDHAGDDGNAYPSQARLAWYMKLAPRTVREILDGLRKMGIVTTERRGDRRSLRYVVEWQGLRERRNPAADAASRAAVDR